MKNEKLVWKIVTCVCTLALVFAFTTAMVGCAEKTAGAKETCPKECAHKASGQPCPKTCPHAAQQPAAAKPVEKPAEKPITTVQPAPAAHAQPAPAPAHAQPAPAQPAPAPLPPKKP
jgi:hypothetical protein